VILKVKKYYSGFIQKPVHLAERLKARNSGMSFKIFRIKILSFLA